MRDLSPLRYPGGKSKLSPLIIELIKFNGIEGCHYVEPYVGGGGVALRLLERNMVERVHLNDLNYPVSCFWHSLVNESDSFIKKLDRCVVSVNAWERHKKIVARPHLHSKLEVGFSFFFINRVSRSGIINGGVIGGYNQSGKWKIDARFNKDTLKRRIEFVASNKNRISISNMDACEFVESLSSEVVVNSLLYLDPPYYEKGQRLYDNFYGHSDHEVVRDSVSKLKGVKWLVSYDNNPEIVDLYAGFKKRVYDLRYSAAKNYSGSEVMFFSDSLMVPDALFCF